MAPIMTKKLRILIIILALLLAVSAFATTATADSGDGSITVSTTDINTTTGMFTATVSISGNPGVSGMSLRLSFDTSKLTPVSFDASSGIYPQAYSNMTADSADPAALDEITYFFAASEDIKANGELFRVSFKVADGAVGTTDLSISYAAGGVVDSKYNALAPSVSGCTVDISSAQYPGGVITLESEHMGLDYYRVNVGLYGNMSLAALRFKLVLSDSVVIRSVDFDGIFDNVTSNSTQSGINLSALENITYNYANTENVTKKGKLFSFTLRLIDGFGKISVSYENGDIVNSDLEILSPKKSALTLGSLDVATVSFDANTSLSLSGETPSDITFVKNGYITLPFCPERGDKAYFLGWSEDKNATAAAYKAGEKYLVTADVTLYAVWTVRTYTVKYNANGGSGAPTAQTKVHGAPITLSESVPTRANYDFAGWSLLADGTATDYAPGDVYAENISVTLYAVWRPHSYKITFDANGGSGAPAPEMKLYGTDVTLSTAVPTKSGAGFAGWSETKGGSVKYLPGATYSANGDATLYAVWTSEKYDVTFDANGGSGAPSKISMAKTLDLVIPLTEPEKEGYTFIGWAETKTATTAEYKIGDTYQKKTSVTLYAVWETAKYTVTFDVNGGNGNFTPLAFSHGGSVTLPSAVPTKTGFDFLGWAESADAKSAEYAPGSTYAYNRSATLYAVWSAHKYNVVFNANGGTNAPAMQYKLHGTDLRLTAVKPILEGNVFLGWAESADALEPTLTAGTLYKEDRDITLYALWTPITYKVTYNVNDGTGKLMGTEIKTHGIPHIIAPYYPTKKDHTFLGWAYSPEAQLPDLKSGDYYRDDADVTLYAVWAAKEYTVIYDANGGTSAPGAQKKPHGTLLTLVKVKPVYEGHVFVGWSSTPDGTAIEYLPGDTYSADEDITLYAIWYDETSAANIELKTKLAGKNKIKLEVLLTSNPGISYLSLRLDFDRTKVKLIDVAQDEDGEPLGVLSGISVNFNTQNIPQDTSYVNINWYNSSNRKSSGAILTLTFEILCDLGDTADFSVNLVKDTLNASGKKIPTGVHSITYMVSNNYTPGDLNSDGSINSIDAVLLAQFIAGWDVELDEMAADCNGDGSINSIDAVLLAQYIAGWDVTLG